LNVDAEDIELVAMFGVLVAALLCAGDVLSPDQFWPFAFGGAVLWGLSDVIGVRGEE
jgi:hypothetical protein